jgi:hypothetical protein
MTKISECAQLLGAGVDQANDLLPIVDMSEAGILRNKYIKITQLLGLITDIVGLLDLKGSTDCSANPNYPAASKGDTYRVSVAGKIGGASGKVVEASDVYYALADNAGGTEAGVGTNWDVIQGNATSAGVGGVQDIPIMAAAMTGRTTSGAAAGSSETTTNKVMVATLDFDPGTDEFAQFMVPMPKSWNEGTVTAKFIWTASAGTVAQVARWGIQAVALSDDDALDTAFGTAQEVDDALLALGDVHHSAFTSAITIAGTPAERDLVVFQVFRNADHANDNLSGDAKLIGVVLQLTTNAADDS